MNILKNLVISAGLIVASTSANALIIDFQALADGSPGEGGYSTMMFDTAGNLVNSGSFLDITGTDGANSTFAYLDSSSGGKPGGLGVCGVLDNGAQCVPGSDDNVSTGTTGAEFLHFAFGGTVIIDRIWFNNNHDGDHSLLNDYIAIGTNGGSTTNTLLNNGGTYLDSVLSMGLTLNGGGVLDIGYAPCGGYINNCEFYISAIEYRVPEPTILALLGIGLVGMGVARRRLK